jgi:3'(2'), 5'-bisphosphate nucleotidase
VTTAVTAADEAADAHISAGLRAAFDVALVTEEQAESHSVTANILIVDPLDGTKEFIHRRGDFYREHRLCSRRSAASVNCLRTRGWLLLPTRGDSVEEVGDWTKNTVEQRSRSLFRARQYGLGRRIQITAIRRRTIITNTP